MKKTINMQVIVHALAYGAETCKLKETGRPTVGVFEMKHLKQIVGMMLCDRMIWACGKNEERLWP